MTVLKPSNLMSRTQDVLPLLLNLPAVILLLAFIAYPIGISFWMSLHRYNLRRPDQIYFHGLENYTTILASSEFWNALWISLYFTFMSVLLVIVIAISISLLLHESFHGRGVVRALLLIPWAVPGVVNGLMW